MKDTNSIAITFSDDSVQIISSEKIRQDLEDLIFAVHSAFEDAPRLAKQFFEDQNHKVDPFLVNDLIRYYIKKHLASLRFDVTEDYSIDNLPNNGLSVRYKGYHVRVLKADRGELPIPNSDKKIEFYGQQLSLDSLVDDSGNLREVALRPNVLILWELTNSYDFNQLYLACPKTGGRKRELVTAHFNEPIEHLVYSIKPDDQTVGIEEDEIEITRMDIAENGDRSKTNNDTRREDKAGT